MNKRDNSFKQHGAMEIYTSEFERAQQELEKGYNISRKEFEDEIRQNRLAHSLFSIFPMVSCLGFDGFDSGHFNQYGILYSYKLEIDDTLGGSLVLAQMGYYSSAFSLLRLSLELMCRGAFYNCIAKKRYRDNCQLIDKKSKPDKNGERATIRKIISYYENESPGITKFMEQNTGVLLDMLAEYQEERYWFSMFPRFSEIVKQLVDWGHFEPIKDAYRAIYEGGYHLLSLPVHGHPYKIDAGKKSYDGTSPFERPTFEEERFREYIVHLNTIIDISTVLLFNIVGPENESPLVLSYLDSISKDEFYRKSKRTYSKMVIQSFLKQK